MILSRFKPQPGILFVCLAALILLVDSASVNWVPSAGHDRILGYAVIFDFALVIPFLYWLCVARPKGKSVRKVIPFTVAGALAAWFVLPVELRGMVWDTVWPVEAVISAAELFFIGYEIRILYRFIRAVRLMTRLESDTAEALRMAVKKEFGSSKVALIFLHDMCMFYYLIFSWKRKSPSSIAGETPYTYHKKTNQMLYAGIITHVIVFEAVFVHLLMQQWSHWAAWILTVADVWILILLWADCRASVLRPVKLVNGTIRLRYGLRIQADVPLDAIDAITAAREYEPNATEKKTFAGPVVGTPNVRIAFNRPVQVEGLMFLPRLADGIYLTLDDPQAFVQEIERARG